MSEDIQHGALGIDLGTTNSVVAAIDRSGRPVIVRNGAGEETTPSVVYFSPDGTVLVGESARNGVAADPDNGVALIKREMGTEFPIAVRNTFHTPESITAIILRYLTANHPKGTPVVITVPAYFGLAEHEATQQAAVIAGLDVLELVAEPVAAAAHYGVPATGDTTVLVYDLGGGTFDTTLLRVGGGNVNVVAVDGDARLGGADIDQRLLTTVVSRIQEQTPSIVDHLMDDDAAMGSLVLEVERVKKQLSARTEGVVSLRWSGSPLSIPLTRADLESSCADLLSKTYDIVEQVLAAGRQRGVASVGHVLLVGGSSRLPAISAHLERSMGVTPRLVEPDLAVAKGAALRAYQLTRHRSTKAGVQHVSESGMPAGLAKSLNGEIRSAVSRGFGILITDSFESDGREIVQHVVHANEPLPLRRTVELFGTIVEDQETVRIQIFEQAGTVESQLPADNRRVLDGELSGLSALPAGTMIRLDFEVALDGRLHVTAIEPSSGRTLRLEAFVEGVVDEVETVRLTQLVRALKVTD